MIHNINAIKRIARQLNYVLDKKQKKASIIVFLCMILSSGLELLGVSAIYPFLQIMSMQTEIKSKWYIKLIYNFLPNTSEKTILLILGILIIFIYLLKNFFMIISAYVQNAYAAKFQRRLSTKMLSAYLNRSYEFFLNTNSSEILRGIGLDIIGVYQILLNTFSLLAETLTIIVLGLFLITTDAAMTIGAMLLAFLCMIGTILGFKDRMKSAGIKAREAAALKGKYGYQAITGIKEIIVLDRKNNFIDQYNEAAILEQRAYLINGVINACPDRILEGVCIGGIIGIVCVRIVLGVELNAFIPVLGAFAMAAFKVLPSISKISTRINTIIYHQASLQGIYNNLKEVNEYEKKLLTHLIGGDSGAEQIESVKFSNELTINNIYWKYTKAKENVLEGTELVIKRGEAVAFIGASGAGKTTLADLIMGLLKPQSGTILMDGIDVFTIPHHWAKIIGYVPQSVFLIDDTVRNNVAFGLKGNEIHDKKVWEALKQAQLEDFVKKLPHGLDTMVGERGVKFSGGQRQRIAIARALYENPDILVLDEATSALDNETETAVMGAINALQGSKTLIIVAHRLSTIRNCDAIYEIKDGKAVRRIKEEVLAEV